MRISELDIFFNHNVINFLREYVVILTTFGATSDENFVKMTSSPFQWFYNSFDEPFHPGPFQWRIYKSSSRYVHITKYTFTITSQSNLRGPIDLNLNNKSNNFVCFQMEWLYLIMLYCCWIGCKTNCVDRYCSNFDIIMQLGLRIKFSDVTAWHTILKRLYHDDVIK